MELKDFVSETLQQIVLGTVEAQEAIKDKNATINPRGIAALGGLLYHQEGPGSSARNVQMVDFDISLVETAAGEKGGRIAVGFSPLEPALVRRLNPERAQPIESSFRFP